MDQELVLMLALFFASAVVGYAFLRLWEIEKLHPDHCNHHWEFQHYLDRANGEAEPDRLYRCIRCGKEDID